MITLQDLRSQYPEYKDVPDADLAVGLRNKFYPEMPQEEFNQRVGFAAPDDKYMKSAKEDFARQKAKGLPVGAGTARLAAQGMTLNTADEILAGLMTPFEMARKGTLSPVEGYRYAKAREDLDLSEGRKELGGLGKASEIAGGIFSGAGLAKGGLTAANMLPKGAGLFKRTLASAADAAGFGAVAGFGEGDSLDERLQNATRGGATGAIVGGAVPPAISAAGQALSPVVSNIMARINPEKYAQRQVARAAIESGLTPQQIAAGVGDAASEGQGVYTLADALGNPGQRLLSTVTRAPGRGRTDAVEFLENRQAGQGRRISNALSEGFDSPLTARQTESALTAARDAEADVAYGAARKGAGAVDVSPVISRIDETLQPGVNQIASPKSGLANDSIEGALDSIRQRLTDGKSNLSDYTAVERVRGDVSDMLQAARRAGAGNKARLLGNVLRELDNSMEAASSGFKQANRNYSQATRDIESVTTGRNAAMRGRTEDTLPVYGALSPQGQQAFRAGYVDPLIEATQGAASTANKARPLINDAFQTEAAAIAPGNPLMQRKLAREQTMFETRGHALGGSRTADNLADQAAAGIDPSIIKMALTGNWGGVARSVMTSLSNGWNGNTAGVREEIGRMLLQRGANVNSAHIQRTLDELVKRIESMTQISRAIGRGASGGLAVGNPGGSR